MPLRLNIIGGLLCLTSAVAGFGQSATPKPYVVAGDIVEAMRHKGISVREEQVSMPSSIPARKNHPALEALKADTFSPDAVRLLMRCADRVSCIPFYAVVGGITLDKKMLEELPVGKRSSLPRSSREPVVIKRGSMATLEIVASEMLITLRVVCLQSGRQGERIRVSSIDQKNTYLAEVLSPVLLRSRL